jgi:FkbM family methyltransferase
LSNSQNLSQKVINKFKNHLYSRFFSRVGIKNGLKYFKNFKHLVQAENKNGTTSLPLGLGPEVMQLRNGTTDIKIYEQIFLNHDVKLPFNFPINSIADCGSHIGCSALYLNLEYPGAEIHCFEAEKRNYELLKSNTTPYKNIHCHHAAVWFEKTKVNIQDPKEDPWTFRVGSNEKNGEIDTFTLDDISDLYPSKNLDLIKIDIEGAEKVVFEHLNPDWLTKVKVINIELHDRIVSGCTQAFTQALESVPHQRYETQHNVIADLRPELVKP